MGGKLKPILIGLFLGAFGVLLVGFAVAGDGTGAASIADQLSTAAKEPVPFTARLQSFFGIFLLLGIAWGLSNDRSSIPWRIIGWGLSLQFIFFEYRNRRFLRHIPAGNIFKHLLQLITHQAK